MLACVISWADDGAVTIVGQHSLGKILLGHRRWLSALHVGTFVATLLTFANSAYASCGDYVIFRPQGAVPVATDRPAPDRDHLLAGKAPCHGPLCRGSKPHDPVPTPPPPQQIDQRLLAILDGGAAVESPYLAGGGWPRLDGSPLDGFGQSVLRPPCA